MNGGWIFLILLILFGLLGAGGWFAYTKYWKPRHSGGSGSNYTYPAPAPSSLADRAKDLWNRLRNPKTQTGAGYEATGGYRSAGGRRGGPLDTDEEAWDARVGGEADVYGSHHTGGGGAGNYYEEQELGLHGSTEYQGAGGAGGGFRQAETLGAPSSDRPRSKSPAGANPFGDDNAASLRSVSPRPHVDTRLANAGGKGSAESSPTFERRSIFREEM